MKPIDFPERNNMVAESQEEYITLPSYVDNSHEGHVIFCMGLSFRERITVLFTGNIWCDLMCFGRPVTPSYFSTKKSSILVGNKRSILSLAGRALLRIALFMVIAFYGFGPLHLVCGSAMLVVLLGDWYSVNTNSEISDSFDRDMEDSFWLALPFRVLPYLGVFIYVYKIIQVI